VASRWQIGGVSPSAPAQKFAKRRDACPSSMCEAAKGRACRRSGQGAASRHRALNKRQMTSDPRLEALHGLDDACQKRGWGSPLAGIGSPRRSPRARLPSPAPRAHRKSGARVARSAAARCAYATHRSPQRSTPDTSDNAWTASAVLRPPRDACRGIHARISSLSLRTCVTVTGGVTCAQCPDAHQKETVAPISILSRGMQPPQTPGRG
jgi:hypothetical protein